MAGAVEPLIGGCVTVDDTSLTVPMVPQIDACSRQGEASVLRCPLGLHQGFALLVPRWMAVFARAFHVPQMQAS